MQRKTHFVASSFVIHVATWLFWPGLPQASEGNIGLMKAVKRFNLKLVAAAVSFAVHWFAEIHEYVLRNIVKVATTKAQRKLFFIRKTKQRLGWFENK